MNSFLDISLPQNWTIGRTLKWTAFSIGAIMFLILMTTLFKKNDAGYYQVRQNHITGSLIVRWTPGIYFNGLCKVTTYQIETSYTFSDDPKEKNVIGKAIPVRFNDGGIGRISGDFRFQLPSNEQNMIRIHEIFGSPNEMMEELYIPAVKKCVFTTSQLMSSEESYTNKSQFPQRTRDQLLLGVYQTEEYSEKIVDTVRGTTEVKKRVRIRTDSVGNPLRQEPVLKTYGINITQAAIREPRYDQNILTLIAKKREFEVNITVAQANAEEAHQQMFTAIEEGKRAVTEAEYEALQKKEKAVEASKKDRTVALTHASKRLEVAKQTFRAETSRADGLIAQAKGEAERRRKVKQADNALVARAEAYKDILGYYAEAYTKIGWSPRIATTAAALGENGLPPGYIALMRISELVRRDLGLDLSF